MLDRLRLIRSQSARLPLDDLQAPCPVGCGYHRQRAFKMSAHLHVCNAFTERSVRAQLTTTWRHLTGSAVQHACNALYRMTRDARAPLFQTHAGVNRQLLHFRFMAHNFVETLVSYVFDVAIRGNYDAFLDRLDAPTVPFSDISAVAEEYSGMLDNVLSACLLRSSQRSIADLLRGLLELVLDLCTLCGEMRRSNLEEYKAVPIFEEVFARYRRRLTSLVRDLEASYLQTSTESLLQVNALKNIVEKQSASSYLPADYAHLALGADERFTSGATGNLYQLLMRIDVNDWISSRPAQSV